MSKIEEMSGVTGSSNVATRQDVKTGERDWRSRSVGNWRLETREDTPEEKRRKQVTQQLAALKQKKKKTFKGYLKSLFDGQIFSVTLLENNPYDMGDIFSRLKGVENKEKADRRDTVTYGVEDDNNNIMKVTVRSDQAKEFEEALAKELGDLEDFKKNSLSDSDTSNNSLAELLFKFKDAFDIIDVEFPTIPTDAVYNADKITLGVDTDQSEISPNPLNSSSNPGEMSTNDMNPGEDTMNDEMPADGGMDQGGDPMNNGGQEFDDASTDNDDLSDLADVESSEDFVEEPEPESFQSLFKGLLSMMTSQAEASKAQAEAEAEKARALTAEYSMKAANGELAKQEDLLRMRAQMDEQKKKDKEAKELADLAKYNISRKNSTMPAFESVLTNLKNSNKKLNEELLPTETGSESSIRKELSLAKDRYALKREDDPQTQSYKRIALSSTITELNAKLRKIRAAMVYQNAMKTKQTKDNANQNNNNSNQNNNNNMNQNNNSNQNNNMNQNNNSNQNNNIGNNQNG